MRSVCQSWVVYIGKRRGARNASSQGYDNVILNSDKNKKRKGAMIN